MYIFKYVNAFKVLCNLLGKCLDEHALEIKGHITHTFYVHLMDTNHVRYIELLAHKEFRNK